MADYYEVLGVSRRASTDEITKAYRALVMKYHPDQHAQNDLRELAEEKLKLANEAYETLKSPQRRRLYDAGVGSPFSQGGPQQGPVHVPPRSLARAALVTAGWVIGVPLLFRLSHNPQLFGALLVTFFAWRTWRRIKRKT